MFVFKFSCATTLHLTRVNEKCGVRRVNHCGCAQPLHITRINSLSYVIQSLQIIHLTNLLMWQKMYCGVQLT